MLMTTSDWTKLSGENISNFSGRSDSSTLPHKGEEDIPEANEVLGPLKDDGESEPREPQRDSCLSPWRRQQRAEDVLGVLSIV